MPTAARIAALIARHGQPVTVRFAPTGRQPVQTLDLAFRTAAFGAGGPWPQVAVTAHLRDSSDRPVVDGANVQQGDREMRIAQAALDAAGALRAPRDGDQVVADGATFMVLSADRRALRGSPALLVVQLRGG